MQSAPLCPPNVLLALCTFGMVLGFFSFARASFATGSMAGSAQFYSFCWTTTSFMLSVHVITKVACTSNEREMYARGIKGLSCVKIE